MSKKAKKTTESQLPKKTVDNFAGFPLRGTEFTPASRARFFEAKEALIRAIEAQAGYYLAADKESSFAAASEVNEVLLNAAITYAEAQRDLAGNVLPFGDLQPWRIF